MGLFDKLFHKLPRKRKYAKALNGYTPIFSQFGTDIYASDVVQQAVKCIVDEVKKVNPTHIRKKGRDIVPVPGNVQAILDNPNPLMTSIEFLEKITWLLMLNYNAFIVPVYHTWTDPKTGAQRREYEALYPIKPIQVDFIEDGAGRLYCHFFFSNGYDTTVPYDDIIHIKYNYSIGDFMGGDESGQPNHRALLKTLELNSTLLEGVAKAMKASYAINGVVQYNTLMDDGKTEVALEELEAKLQKSESGFLPLDLKAAFTPLERHTAIVDENTLKFVDEKILRNFGVPLCILTGDYTKAQYEAFYQKTLEPIIKSMSQAFTKKLFTQREKSFGNEIAFYPEDLIFLSADQTLRAVELLSPTGGLFENEKRTALGLKPLPELEGKRLMSLNWVDVDIAREYQVGQKDSADTDNTDTQDTENDTEVKEGEDDVVQ